ncbi:hypothetical protein PGT21_002877 [Puccinia graminis f. sp. tritici]|uniref:Uncharacterized protein n=1 Tax=Puccinia graminis f. sp. tritici TaxID=56615 RepID=A0A5B0NXE2_PUCGR|nr:hypothetical protein PGT21_002877 [Puccinia graminis f. sp. tritici]KAA1129967.1 hypothetical protein PGTUg99_003202 [Puccinia graminis f. sp. tritici]
MSSRPAIRTVDTYVVFVWIGAVLSGQTGAYSQPDAGQIQSWEGLERYVTN